MVTTPVVSTEEMASVSVAETVDGQEEMLGEILSTFNITVKQCRTSFEGSEALNKLASYVGEHWDSFQDLWLTFKRGLQGRNSITKFLDRYPPEDVSYMCNLCIRMKELAFLSNYHYAKAPKYQLFAEVSRQPVAQAFIGGEWFERYLFTEVQVVFNQYCADCQCVKHLRCWNDTVIRLPDQKEAELDLFFEVDGLLFWIEAKSADYQHHIEKYNRMAKTIGLPQKQVMLVCLDLKETACMSLTMIYPYLTVLNPQILRLTLRCLFCEAFGEPPKTLPEEVITKELQM